MKSRAASIDHEWLVKHFRMMEAAHKSRTTLPARARENAAYIKGRIDEFCAQNAITPEDRRAAAREAGGEVPAMLAEGVPS